MFNPWVSIKTLGHISSTKELRENNISEVAPIILSTAVSNKSCLFFEEWTLPDTIKFLVRAHPVINHSDTQVLKQHKTDSTAITQSSTPSTPSRGRSILAPRIIVLLLSNMLNGPWEINLKCSWKATWATILVLTHEELWMVCSFYLGGCVVGRIVGKRWDLIKKSEYPRRQKGAVPRFFFSERDRYY